MRALAVVLVAGLLTVGLAALAGFLALAGLPPDERVWRPVIVPGLGVAPFIGAFLVVALGFVMLQLRDGTRLAGAPAALTEAEAAFEGGRTDEAHLALRRACESLRGESPVADGLHVSGVAQVVVKLAGSDGDPDLLAEARALAEAPLPIEPSRLSLLLAYVDAHAEAVASRAARAPVESPPDAL